VIVLCLLFLTLPLAFGLLLSFLGMKCCVCFYPKVKQNMFSKRSQIMAKIDENTTVSPTTVGMFSVKWATLNLTEKRLMKTAFLSFSYHKNQFRTLM